MQEPRPLQVRPAASRRQRGVRPAGAGSAGSTGESPSPGRSTGSERDQASPQWRCAGIAGAERSAVSGKGSLRPPKKNASAKAWNRYLRRLVRALGACVSSLSPQAQQILVWRTGHGRGRGESEAQVARRLGTSLRRERKLESQAARALRVAAADGRCGQAPVPVSVSSGLLAAAPADVLQDLTRGTEGSPATQTGTSSPAAGQLSQPKAAGSRGSEVRHHPGDHNPEELAADTAHCWIGLPVAAPPDRRTGCRCSDVGSLAQVDDGQLHWRSEAEAVRKSVRPARRLGAAGKPPPRHQKAATRQRPPRPRPPEAQPGRGRRRRPPSSRKTTTDAGAGSPRDSRRAGGCEQLPLAAQPRRSESSAHVSRGARKTGTDVASSPERWRGDRPRRGTPPAG